MHQSIQDTIVKEIDSRISRLKEHLDDPIIQSGNQYEELNQALSKVINVPLVKELEDLKGYIEDLS